MIDKRKAFEHILKITDEGISKGPHVQSYALLHIQQLIIGYLSDDQREEQQAEKSGVWQFYQDGEWHTGSNTHNHRENTENAGYPTRDLYVHPPKFLASVNHEPVGEVQPMLLVNFENPNDAKSIVLVDPELPLGTKVYLHPADPRSMVIDLAMKDAEYTGIGMFKMDSSGSITRVSPSDRLKSD